MQQTQKRPAVYILASKRNGTLYTGVTSDLITRVWQHKQGFVESFTSRYKIKSLVWYEMHSDMYTAITREKSIKNWSRKDKLRLIEMMNPLWLDLYNQITG